MKKVFNNAFIITQNSKREIFTNGMIIVNKNEIEYVGPTIEIEGQYRIIDLNGRIVLPGFINNHTHLQASTLKGSLEGLTLEQYLFYNEKIREKHNSETQKRYRETAISVGILESLKSGITTCCSSNCEELAKIHGLRMYTGPFIMNVERLMNDYLKLYSNKSVTLNRNDMVSPMLFVHSLYKIGLDILPAIKKILDDLKDCLLSIHVAETKEEVDYICSKTGKYPIELLDHFGLVTSKTLLVHCTFIKDFEVEIIANRRAKIVVCPVSNIRLGEEIPNIPLFKKKRIKFCIATDGLATNGSFDMLLNARITYFAILLKYGERLSSQFLLDMISVNAAEVLENKAIGSLDKGKKADFLVLKKDILALHPTINLIDNLIFSCNYEHVEDVYINGNQIIKNGDFGFNFDGLLNEYNNMATNLKKKLDKEQNKNEYRCPYF